MKIFVASAFVLIIGSLASALFYLMRDKGGRGRGHEGDKGKGPRTVRALAFRVGFSITLFVIILVLHRLGYIQPTGLH